MAAINTYKVHYHWERPGGIKATEEKVSYCQAADNSYNSLKAAIVTAGGHVSISVNTFVIDAVQNVGVSATGIDAS